MDCEEIRVDMRETGKDAQERYAEEERLLFEFNHTLPHTPESQELAARLFGELGDGSFVNAPLQGIHFKAVKIGRNAVINTNTLMMARGGITIEDEVMIASNVQLLTNNHDPYEREILLCKPVLIKKGAWIGAGASILPGVCVGRYAIVGAGSLVTKDVPDYCVAVGSPAKVIKELDKERFERLTVFQ